MKLNFIYLHVKIGMMWKVDFFCFCLFPPQHNCGMCSCSYVQKIVAGTHNSSRIFIQKQLNKQDFGEIKRKFCAYKMQKTLCQLYLQRSFLHNSVGSKPYVQANLFLDFVTERILNISNSMAFYGDIFYRNIYFQNHILFTQF